MACSPGSTASTAQVTSLQRIVVIHVPFEDFRKELKLQKFMLSLIEKLQIKMIPPSAAAEDVTLGTTKSSHISSFGGVEPKTSVWASQVAVLEQGWAGTVR